MPVHPWLFLRAMSDCFLDVRTVHQTVAACFLLESVVLKV